MVRAIYRRSPIGKGYVHDTFHFAPDPVRLSLTASVWIVPGTFDPNA